MELTWKSDTSLNLRGLPTYLQKCSKCGNRSTDVRLICIKCLKHDNTERVETSLDLLGSPSPNIRREPKHEYLVLTPQPLLNKGEYAGSSRKQKFWSKPFNHPMLPTDKDREKVVSFVGESSSSGVHKVGGNSQVKTLYLNKLAATYAQSTSDCSLPLQQETELKETAGIKSKKSRLAANRRPRFAKGKLCLVSERRKQIQDTEEKLEKTEREKMATGSNQDGGLIEEEDLERVLLPSLLLGCKDFGFAVMTAVTHALNICAIVYMSAMHFKKNSTVKGCLAIGSFIVGQIFLTFLMMQWILSYDSEFVFDEDRKKRMNQPTDRVFSVLRICSLFTGLDPIVRATLVILYGTRTLVHMHDKERESQVEVKVICVMDYHLEALSTLALVEAIVVSVPQLMFEIPFWTSKDTWYSLHRTECLEFVCCLSTCAMQFVWAVITNFPYDERDAIQDKGTRSMVSQTLKFLWIGTTVFSRLTILALFASHFGFYMPLACAVHALLVLLWLFCDKKMSVTENSSMEVTAKIGLAIVYAFCYIAPKESVSGEKCKAFYSLLFFENLALYIMTYKAMVPHSGKDSTMDKKTMQDVEFGYKIAIGYIIAFFFAVAFKVLYQATTVTSSYRQMYANELIN